MMVFRQFLLILAVTNVFSAYIEPTRNDLMRYLLKEAENDRNFPPNTENATDVFVQLYITDFNSESDQDREIEFTLYLRVNWKDPRLDFTRNETTYDVISFKFGDDIVKNLWIPDLFFLNERQSRLHGLIARDQLVYIYKNGSVFYSGRFNIKLHCVMNFKKYPFDTQICPIEIQSYAYSTDFVLLHWNGDHAVQIDPESDPIKPKIPLQDQSNETRYTYPITGEFSTLKTEIEIPRPKGSYGMMITLPSISLVITALTSFLLGDNITSRIGVPTGTLISLCVQWSGAYSRLSLDSTSEYLDRWMFIHLVFIGIIILANACICHYKYQKDDKGTKGIKGVQCRRYEIDRQSGTSSNTETEETNIPMLERTSDTDKTKVIQSDPEHQRPMQPVREVIQSDPEQQRPMQPVRESVLKPVPSSNTETEENNIPMLERISDTDKTKVIQSDPEQQRPMQPVREAKPSSDSASQYHKTKYTRLKNDSETQMNKAWQSDDGRTQHYLQQFDEAKKNLNSDKRYKWAEHIFDERKLNEVYMEFVREKTENDFYKLLEQSESLIFVQESQKNCFRRLWIKVKQITDRIDNFLKYLDKHDLINIIPCIVILFAYVSIVVCFTIKWTSS